MSEQSAVKKSSSRSRTLIAAICLATPLAGCGTFMTTAAIHQFQEHLEAGDVEAIAATTTDRFRDAAIPNPDALATFDLLGIPIGEITIDEIEETSDTTQDVLVSVAGSSRKLTYHLKKSEDGFATKKWLVDEITMRQGTSSKAVEKTVSDQMELLLGVRDVVRAWQRADADTLADYADSRLANSLASVPSSWRSQIASRYFSGVLKSKPRAKLIDGEAEVQLSHKEGQLRLILERAKRSTTASEYGWVVKTAVIVGRGKEITRELRREVDLLVGVREFVDAYQATDEKELAAVSSRNLYDNVLEIADRSEQPIDPAAIYNAEFDVRIGEVGNEVTVTIDDVVTQFSLKSKADGRQSDMQVDEVTFFDDGQAIQLSAKLLVLPTVVMFNDAINSGEVPTIRYLTSDRWNQSVWSRFDDGRRDVLVAASLPMFDPSITTGDGAVTVTFEGPNCEVRQVNGESVVSYKLTSSAGRLVIDDVKIVDMRGAINLRSRLASLCTLDEMADGILTGDLSAVQNASTDALNKIAWSLTPPEELPTSLDLIPLLKGRVHSIESDDTEMVVTVSDSVPLARFLMTADGSQIDDIVFVDAAGFETGRFAQLVRQHRIHNNKQMTAARSLAPPTTY